MKHLKLFETHSEYEEYINRGGVILPNVSFCEDERGVHYNPYVEPSFFCKLTSSYGYTADIEGSGELTEEMILNAVETKSEIESVEIGTLCTSIGDNTFVSCGSLTSITISNSVTVIGNFAFGDCICLTSIDMSNGVTSIGAGAFTHSDLTSIDIPSGVTSIGNDAFYSCKSLTNVTIEATTPPTLGNEAFVGNASGRKIYVPSASVNTYKVASGWSTYASDILPIS